MNYVLSLFLAILVSAVPAAGVGAPTPGPRPLAPTVKAESAILTDAVNGQILYGKNAHLRRPMASTTKIMTAIIVIENCGMDDIVTASESASKAPFTSLHLKPGEQVKVRDMLAALLIRSANDAALALAEHVGGSEAGFAQMMNDKARQIGATDTHFVNPNGLYAPGHYSTVYDLALIARYALRLPILNELAAARSKTIERSLNKKDVVVWTRSKFLKNYQGADGVKSGYTKQAGYCFVGSATRDGWRLVSVVLKSTDSQPDTTALMDYGFNNYERVVLAVPERPVQKVVVRGGAAELEVVPSQELHVAVKAGESGLARAEVKLDDLSAPIRKGEKVGTMTAYVAAEPVSTVDLQAAYDVRETAVSAAWPWARAIGLLGMIAIGVACGRTAAKSSGNGRRRLA